MDTSQVIYAHTLPHAVESSWEPLEDHAEHVGRLACDFASAFGAGNWGDVLGRWHDLGKRSDAFQHYIRATADPDAGEDEQAPGRVDHSTFGARHAARSVRGLAGKVLAFCIAGHHGHLADATADDEACAGSTLARRLDAAARQIPRVALPADFPPPPALAFPFAPPAQADDVGFAVAFFTRMLFSSRGADGSRTTTMGTPLTRTGGLRRRWGAADLGRTRWMVTRSGHAPAGVPVLRAAERASADFGAATTALHLLPNSHDLFPLSSRSASSFDYAQARLFRDGGDCGH